MKKTGKDYEIAMLLDFYGELLTEKQKLIFEMYHLNDLSLAEISEHLGITRQGVRDSIKRAEATLLEMEDKLGLGYDQAIGSRTKLYLDVYDPEDVKVKLRGEYEVAPQFYLFGQGNMPNKSDERSAYFGLRKTF